jgi:FecR protein
MRLKKRKDNSMNRIFLMTLAFAATGLAQDVVSARAGMIQHIEGDVQVDGVAVTMPAKEKMFSSLPEVKKGSTLTTTEGRAELLLAPGVALRIGEDSAFKMIDSNLADTKLELLKGVAIVEVLEVVKDSLVTVHVGSAAVQFRKPGMFRLHASEKSELLVYEGHAEVTLAGQRKSVKKGNAVSLENVTVARKFDAAKGDALHRWSIRRSSYMAMANVSAASASRSGISTFGWFWNPYYNMYTYVPQRGAYCSNLTGYCYYSPSYVYMAFYNPQPSYSSGMGNTGGGQTSYSYNQNLGYTVASGSRSYGGISSGASSSAVGAPAAAAAPVADSGGGRSGASAGGRGDNGGGRAQ